MTFWARVSNVGGEGCWEWQGARHPHGYGQLSVEGRVQYAHRVSLAEALGRPIRPGYRALHACDNPPCVRTGPGHLYEGTPADNSREMAAKGRWGNRTFQGSANGFAKLTEAAVSELRRLGAEGVRQVDLAERFGITQPCVSLVLRRATWRHI